MLMVEHQTQVKGLPTWYFVLVGLLVGSLDISQQFSAEYPLVSLLPLTITAVHLSLWFGLLSRRREYIRAVWRSPGARVLVLALVAVRLLLQWGLGALTDSVAPLHSYAHLVIGLVMVVLTSVGAWFDQWLVLRTLNRKV
ncbi:hypothetical protein GCM10010174_05260 [Kutzneria viridogrisea]|uniref:Uncharacterized protein n=2 Tax=Kutzneria TaxID=43356 RepID=W5WA93_9PSEU|nr:hypothetical protein [Kutzneria albida]AHH98063.1 hypothetical protein KALB_4701 [Kutzneria albida DSM 43870]MBA8924277.1 hypothetical protein [Kutzneria viridogrisea]